MKSIKVLLNALLLLLLITAIFIIIKSARNVSGFWDNLSLNLLSEIIGALIIAVFIRTEFKHIFENTNNHVQTLVERIELSGQLKTSFKADSPEAWTYLNPILENRLIVLKAKLKNSKIEKQRNSLQREIDITNEYLKYSKNEVDE